MGDMYEVKSTGTRPTETNWWEQDKRTYWRKILLL
ncbi:hypothetical protein LINGRAHAP2_LOCUS1794 [Linum grandiflorum]